MSVGNLKDNGNKGNNFPFQLGALKLLGASQGRFIEEILITEQSATNIQEAIDQYFISNPDKFLISKVILKDGTDFHAFLTVSTLK